MPRQVSATISVKQAAAVKKFVLRVLETFIALGTFAILLGLAARAYPPLVPVALALMNRAPNCRVLDVWKGAKTRYAFSEFRDALAESARLIKQDGHLELWRTSEGDYWIPAGNGDVLLVLLAQQQADEYGDASQGVRPGDIVLDCGAHIGVYSRKALQAGARLVVAIEPAPVNVECLRRNLADDITRGRVIVYPKGVWDKEDLLPLYEDPDNSAADSFVTANPGSEAKVAPLVPIDLLVRELSLETVDVIKMDIKGATVRALTGARETLVRLRPRLIISTEEEIDSFSEISNELDTQFGYRPICGSCSTTGSLTVEPTVVFFQPK